MVPSHSALTVSSRVRVLELSSRLSSLPRNIKQSRFPMSLRETHLPLSSWACNLLIRADKRPMAFLSGAKQTAANIFDKHTPQGSYPPPRPSRSLRSSLMRSRSARHCH